MAIPIDECDLALIEIELSQKDIIHNLIRTLIEEVRRLRHENEEAWGARDRVIELEREVEDLEEEIEDLKRESK